MSRYGKTWGSLALSALLCGCAGPTTPLGAIWSVTPVQAAAIPSDEGVPQKKRAYGPEIDPTHRIAADRPGIRFVPGRQVLHGPIRMRVVIENLKEADFTDYRFYVRYNGFDVTKSFLRQARITALVPEGRIILDVPGVRLSPIQQNLVEFTFKSPQNLAYSRYEPPQCYAFRPKAVHNIGDFDVRPSMLRSIERNSTQAGFNPAFFTALIAQESGFNPQVVSWAHALGLTQVTPVAEEELIRNYPNWPRYEGLKELPVAVVKALVMSGRINPQNEWKLDTEHSVQGGMSFAMKLSERWSTKENLAKIRELFRDPEQAHTQLILASYHSGFARVSSALDKYGMLWLGAPGLKEAQNYVNRILSYCDYFSDEEVALETTS